MCDISRVLEGYTIPVRGVISVRCLLTPGQICVEERRRRRRKKEEERRRKKKKEERRRRRKKKKKKEEERTNTICGGRCISWERY